MSGTERRRRWSDEAKLTILAEADETGACIGDTARRHDIHPGRIRLWRQSFSCPDRPTVFLPVDISEEVGVSQPSIAVTRPSTVEILPRNGRYFKVLIDVWRRARARSSASAESALIGSNFFGWKVRGSACSTRFWSVDTFPGRRRKRASRT